MNNVELIGRLTKDPVMGNGVAMFTLAVDRHDKDKNADFPNIKVFGKQAEIVCKYLKQGSLCAIENGRIETGSYPNKNGETVYYTDVVAGRVEFIRERQNGQNAGQDNSKERDAQEPEANEQEQEANEQEQEAMDSFEEIDEDVPF